MPVNASSPAHRRLLVIEPDALWREIIVGVAGWYFSDVVVATKMPSASPRLTVPSCSVVIVEHQLPYKSGLAIYDGLRQHDAAVVFILMSSDLRVALSDPNFRYLRKPFSREELSALLLSITRTSREGPPSSAAGAFALHM